MSRQFQFSLRTLLGGMAWFAMGAFFGRFLAPENEETLIYWPVIGACVAGALTCLGGTPAHSVIVATVVLGVACIAFLVAVP